MLMARRASQQRLRNHSLLLPHHFQIHELLLCLFKTTQKERLAASWHHAQQLLWCV
jgi:hypothetical protein